MPLTVGSLFDGISGFPLSAYLNGITPVWASENNKYCLKVSSNYFPEVKQYGDVTIPLQAGMGDGRGISYNCQSLIRKEMAVRRLTPVECERLMGFPDNWTLVNKMSDSMRYKMIGNSIAIPVFDWVFGRLVENA